MSGVETVQAIRGGGLIAVLRLASTEDLLPAAEAIRAGGLTIILLDPAPPGALAALERARLRLGREVRLGAGPVLTAEAARAAIRAGAEFLTAPNLSAEVVGAGVESSVPVIPGVFTPTEIVRAHELGAGLVRLFPAGPVGPGYFAELRQSLPHIPLVAAGGVSLENAGSFLRAGAAALEVEGGLVPPELPTRHASAEITARAREFAEAVRRARGAAGRPVQPVRPIEGPDR